MYHYEIALHQISDNLILNVQTHVCWTSFVYRFYFFFGRFPFQNVNYRLNITDKNKFKCKKTENLLRPIE